MKTSMPEGGRERRPGRGKRTAPQGETGAIVGEEGAGLGTFAGLMKSVRDYSLILLNRKGKVIGWGAGARDLTGFTEKEVIGHSYAELFTDEGVRRLEPDGMLEEARVTGRMRAQAPRRRGSGETILLDVVLASLVDSRGTPLGFVEIGRDVTEGHRVQLELLRSQALLWGVLNSSQDAVMALEAVRNAEGNIVDFRCLLGNEAADMLLGSRRRSINGKYLKETLPGHEASGLTDLYLRVCAGGGAESRTVWYEADGIRAWLHAQVVKFGDGVTVTIRDISREKEAENALKEAKEAAEEMDRLKSAVLQNVSHELRTPLSAILGFAEILKEDLEGDQGMMVDDILQGGRRLLSKVNALLDLAQLEAGRATPQLIPVDVFDVVRTVTAGYKDAADAKGILLSTEVADPAEECLALAEPGMLAGALAPIVDNAIKYTEKGSVTVEVGCVGADVVITVRDTGIGMDPTFVPRAFSAFSQESFGAGRRYDGTGIGLTVSAHFVRLLGGDVEVKTEKGKGATFTLCLARAEVPGRSDIGVRAFGDTEERQRILVINRIPAVLGVLRRMLEAEFHLDTATTPEAALAAAQERPPDLLLIDMDGENRPFGSETIARIRQIEGLSGIPAVAMTETMVPEDRARLTSSGFSDYISKPFSRQALVETLRRVIDA
jgi:PAS domain S-box-containing protein